MLPWEKVVGYSARQVQLEAQPARQFDVSYGAPSVVRIPQHQDQWLMFLSRELTAPSAAASPGNCFSDIVVYWSNHPDFVDDSAAGKRLNGPFHVISGLRALPDEPERGAPNFRCLVGVPGVTWHDGALFLYYVAATNFGGVPGDTEIVTPERAFLDEAEGYEAAAAAYGNAWVEEEFHEGIACARIDLQTLVDLEDAEVVDEASWTSTSTLTGVELLGLVRVWVAGGVGTVPDAARQKLEETLSAAEA